MEMIFYRMTWWSLLVLAIGTYTSVSFSALSHILVVIPGGYFTYKAFKEKRLNLDASALSLFALFIVIILSVLFNLDLVERPHKNILKAKYFLIAFLSIFAFRETFANYLDQKKIKILLKLFLFASALATVSGLIGLYTGFNPIKFKDACHATRACGLFGMYMTYGYGVGFLATILTAMVVYREKFKDWISSRWLIICWIISLAGMVLSYARGAWIGFAIALPFIFLRESKKKFFLVILFGLIGAGALFGISEKVRETFTSPSRGESTIVRLSMYKAAFAAFKERPLFGYGYKNFEPNVAKIKAQHKIERPKNVGHAHNNFLEHLASTGIIGFIIVLLFHGLWTKESYFDSGLLGIVTFPLLINFFISGQAQYTFGDGENLFFILGLFSLHKSIVPKT